MPNSASAAINILHTFTGSSSDGNNSITTFDQKLLLSGSKLYGMTAGGGTAGFGVIFSINTDGTGFTVLHSFAAAAVTTNGSKPFGSLIISGSTLYGMTRDGGASNKGIIFSIGTDGTGFTILKSFDGTAGNGGQPYGSLLLSGSTLYGMTRTGTNGVIFSITTSGTSYTILHVFAGGATDGRFPHGDLILSGSTLYGMTTNGGAAANPNGTVFSMATDGTGFTILKSFTPSGDNPTNPYGSLILSGSTLYGMTPDENSSGRLGTIFSISTTGTGYTELHEFVGGASDGLSPYGSLLLSGSTLWGMDAYGGPSSLGNIFSVGTDGSGFALAHSFSGGASNGSTPTGSLILSGLTFYGMDSLGGSSGFGTIFSYSSNTAPSISTDPSDGGALVSPTNVGSGTTFTATATDSGSDNYYLAICKTNAVTAANSAAPTCDGGSWAISSSTASGSQASVTYTALAGDSETNSWYAFVCDHNASSLCSSSSQGTGGSGSPFEVNHTPSFSAISNDAEIFGAGDSITFSATASDADTNETTDTVTVHLCKSNDFSSGACGSAGTWCSSSTASSNPTCSYTIVKGDGSGDHAYYAYVVDNHSLASTSNPRSGSFTTKMSGSSSGSRLSGGGNFLLLSQSNLSTTPVSSTTPISPVTSSYVFPRYLGYSDRGNDVMKLQKLLQNLGFFPVIVFANGNFGPITRSSVRRFQKAYGIRQTGNVGPLTLGALNGL